ncbi:unnamed protein product, partial [Didymodactylos carnosus]
VFTNAPSIHYTSPSHDEDTHSRSNVIIRKRHRLGGSHEKMFTAETACSSSYPQKQLSSIDGHQTASQLDSTSYDSDLDKSTEDLDFDGEYDEEQLLQEENEQQKLIISRQQNVLWCIVREWLRKEEIYIKQLDDLLMQLNCVSCETCITIIEKLLKLHKNVYLEINLLGEKRAQNEHPSNITKQLTHAISELMLTLKIYNDYLRVNLAPVRKILEKKNTLTGGYTAEDILSVPPKQFLQILSQVQDLYHTAQTFDCDSDNIRKLYEFAEHTKTYTNVTDENFNKIILKSEDVVILVDRGGRLRCRLFLYPDSIVCCTVKQKLLVISPKYQVSWFISMNDLHWSIPVSDDDLQTGDDSVRSKLKSSYRELEKMNPEANNNLTSRLTKSTRKLENEYNLSQSKLKLLLSSHPPQAQSLLTSRTTNKHTDTQYSSNQTSANDKYILFSSAYQRQEWIDTIDKAKNELLQRSPRQLTLSKYPLSESIIQKRVDVIKPHLQDGEGKQTLQSNHPQTAKTYSGTLNITIQSAQGQALTRQTQSLDARSQRQIISSSKQDHQQKHYQLYVALEIDSYNTFYPYAQTKPKQITYSNKHGDYVEFKGETFGVELEYSLAFRLLVYRIDLPTTPNNGSLPRSQCIGKFHRNIETALHESDRNGGDSQLSMESSNGDLKLKIQLRYYKREGTFKRRKSKRSLAVFGKSIDKLLNTQDGSVEYIPRIVAKCIEIVERDGLKETGIYRVCCVASELHKLRRHFDQSYSTAESILEQKNVHVAANLLKLFFRELPEPLFTTQLYSLFLRAIQMNDPDNQRLSLLENVSNLTHTNRQILYYLLDHLIRISQHSQQNMMHLENLAVVFGPTLMRPSKLVDLGSRNYVRSGSSHHLNKLIPNGKQETDLDQMTNELQGSMLQCQVVLQCLKLRRDHQLI